MPALRTKQFGLIATLAILAGLAFFVLRPPSASQLEEIIASGELTVLTRNGPTSYFLGKDGPAGFEYDLASAFAGYLGVELVVEIAPEFHELFPRLQDRKGDFIAANITRTPQRESDLRFGPDYAEVSTEVVYRRGDPRPRKPEDLIGNSIRVLKSSSYADQLQALKALYPELRWEESREDSIESLLKAVNEGQIDYTLIDSTIFQLNQPFYPTLRRGFSLGEPQPLGWVFRAGDDDSLLQKAREFFALEQTTAMIASLSEQYYDVEESFDHSSMFTFIKRVESRFPSVRDLFLRTARQHTLDWRLLAAVGYQESHWDPEATSKTGVRGVMMLTQRTASQMGVTDRLDPAQSIDGGARYLLRLLSRLPQRIEDPERTWLALAAYNIGFGHLEDARVLTQKHGGNPDLWRDVKKHLPKLTEERYYKTTRYGYARGYEAVQYVDNIRNFYDTLVWMDTHNHPSLDVDAPSVNT